MPFSMLIMDLLVILEKRVNSSADKHVTKEVWKCEVDSTNPSNSQRTCTETCMKESGKLEILER